MYRSITTDDVAELYHLDDDFEAAYDTGDEDVMLAAVAAVFERLGQQFIDAEAVIEHLPASREGALEAAENGDLTALDAYFAAQVTGAVGVIAENLPQIKLLIGPMDLADVLHAPLAHAFMHGLRMGEILSNSALTEDEIQTQMDSLDDEIGRLLGEGGFDYPTDDDQS